MLPKDSNQVCENEIEETDNSVSKDIKLSGHHAANDIKAKGMDNDSSFHSLKGKQDNQKSEFNLAKRRRYDHAKKIDINCRIKEDRCCNKNINHVEEDNSTLSETDESKLSFLQIHMIEKRKIIPLRIIGIEIKEGKRYYQIVDSTINDERFSLVDSKILKIINPNALISYLESLIIKYIK